MNRQIKLCPLSVLVLTLFLPVPGFAQEVVEPRSNASVLDKALINDVGKTPKRIEAVIDNSQIRTEAEMKELYSKFSELMKGAKLQGQFTVDGKPMDQLRAETYEIETAEKQAKGDDWVIKARIKYGKYDTVFPVPVEVKWAGKTPVITLDNMTIPGMGTFGARVVFHKDKYAGTWSHDEVGGHMFGKIIFAKDEEKTNE